MQKHVNDVSNFFICDFQPKSLSGDSLKSRKSQKALWIKDYLHASSIATATATVIPTIGLLPAPMRPIISVRQWALRRIKMIKSLIKQAFWTAKSFRRTHHIQFCWKHYIAFWCCRKWCGQRVCGKVAIRVWNGKFTNLRHLPPQRVSKLELVVSTVNE